MDTVMLMKNSSGKLEQSYMIKLEVPKYYHKSAAIELCREYLTDNSIMNGAGGMDKSIDDYEGWVDRLEGDINYNNIKGDMIPANTYFAIRQNDEKIIGMINIRHRLNERLLKNGGHIGYSVRPTERKKGYATEILGLGLLYCRKLGLSQVLITCDRENSASAKVIINNGGILENEIKYSEWDYTVQRYWIYLA
jgi:predicted acetyltransferase